MEKLIIKKKNIIWSISNKQRVSKVLTPAELLDCYKTKKHPINGSVLSIKTLNTIFAILCKMAGKLWLKQLKIGKTRLPTENLSTRVRKSGIQIGKGTFGTVYSYMGLAVKVVRTNKKMHISGELEYSILKHLLINIVYKFKCPGIVTVCQYIHLPRSDYIILEKLDSTLWNYLYQNVKPEIIKNIIMQVLFTLAILQTTIPGFRHNDLKINNILLDFGNTETIYLSYKEHVWYIPKQTPIVKLADFDYANLPKIINNSKIKTEYCKSFGCSATPNDIYDLHVFLNSMYSKRKHFDSKTFEWIKSCLPAKARGMNTQMVKFGRLVEPSKWINKIKTPLQLLKTPFFKDYCVAVAKYPTWGI